MARQSDGNAASPPGVRGRGDATALSAFAWLPFVLAGAAGQPALDKRRPRALRLRRRGRLVVPAAGALLTRRAALLQALVGTATATGAIAGLSILARGGPTARAVAPAGTPVAASAAVAAGSGLSVANPLGGSAALLVRSPDGTLAAYEAVCPHAGCKVGWTAGEIVCPCHHARFDPATGQPTRGPARTPLEVVEVVERDGKVFLA